MLSLSGTVLIRAAARLPPATPLVCGGRRAACPRTQQADGSSRPAGGAVAAQLMLGGRDEERDVVELEEEQAPRRADCDLTILGNDEGRDYRGLAVMIPR
jgi:hypothetical protein